jgi:hypothetical protein
MTIGGAYSGQGPRLPIQLGERTPVLLLACCADVRVFASPLAQTPSRARACRRSPPPRAESLTLLTPHPHRWQRSSRRHRNSRRRPPALLPLAHSSRRRPRALLLPARSNPLLHLALLPRARRQRCPLRRRCRLAPRRHPHPHPHQRPHQHQHQHQRQHQHQHQRQLSGRTACFRDGRRRPRPTARSTTTTPTVPNEDRTSPSLVPSCAHHPWPLITLTGTVTWKKPSAVPAEPPAAAAPSAFFAPSKVCGPPFELRRPCRSDRHSNCAGLAAATATRTAPALPHRAVPLLSPCV